MAASVDISGTTLKLTPGHTIQPYAFGTGFGFYNSSGSLVSYCNTANPTVSALSAFLSSLQIHGHCYPNADNSFTCGKSGQRWSAIWSGNSLIQTSDARMKENVVNLPEDLGLSFIEGLRPVTYTWLPTVNTDPDSGVISTIVHTRTHLGLIAQEVESLIGSTGRTLNDVDIVDNDALASNASPDELDRYGMRYSALIPSLIKAIQELSEKNALLEARITALESV